MGEGPLEAGAGVVELVGEQLAGGQVLDDNGEVLGSARTATGKWKGKERGRKGGLSGEVGGENVSTFPPPHSYSAHILHFGCGAP